MNCFKWLFTRWYYWLLVFLDLITFPSDGTMLLDHVGELIGTMLRVGLILLFIRLIARWIGLGAKKKKG